MSGLLDTNVSIFTTKMRTEFIKAYKGVQEPAPWEEITFRVNSTARIEHFPWMSPAPGPARYKGYRRFARMAPVVYRLANVEFDAAYEVEMRDIEDAQIGYEMKAQEMAQKCKDYPGRHVLKLLSAGTQVKCFDGTNFFATSHEIGQGDNLMTGTGSANTDGLQYRLIALYTAAPLKPMLWLDRKRPTFMTDAGSPQSKLAKKVKYWVDFEGQAGFGYWWHAIQYTFTNLPNVADLHTAFQQIENRFRTFRMPQATETDEFEWIYEQTVFSSKNLVFVHATALTEIFRQALNQDWVPQVIGSGGVATTNRFKGFATHFPSVYLNPGVTINTDDFLP